MIDSRGWLAIRRGGVTPRVHWVLIIVEALLHMTSARLYFAQYFGLIFFFYIGRKRRHVICLYFQSMVATTCILSGDVKPYLTHLHLTPYTSRNRMNGSVTGMLPSVGICGSECYWSCCQSQRYHLIQLKPFRQQEHQLTVSLHWSGMRGKAQ